MPSDIKRSSSDVAGAAGGSGPLPTYGTLASRPAANTQTDKTLYIATDQSGGTLYQAQGSAWVQIAAGVLDTGGRELAYAEATANQGPLTAITDITGLTITFTVGVRPVMLELWVPDVQSSVAAGGVTLYITDNSNNIVSRVDVACPAAATNYPPNTVEKRLALAAGSYTYKARFGQFLAGNATIIAGAPRPMFLQAREL